MGCSQSKPTDVSVPDDNNAYVTKKEEFMEHKLEMSKIEEPEAEELKAKQDEEEPMDEASKILEPVAHTIDLTAMERTPGSSPVDVPDSVRANFSSFNISFIDPTVSAPTSATTEPNIASTRMTVMFKDLMKNDMEEIVTEKDTVHEVESNGETQTEEAAGEQDGVADMKMVEEQVAKEMEAPAARTEEHVATIETVKELTETEVIMDDVAAPHEEETGVEEQNDIKVEVAASSVGTEATTNIEEVNEVTEVAGKVEEGACMEAKEFVAGSEETGAVVEESVATVENTEKEYVVEPVVEVVADPSAENVAGYGKEEMMFEPAKDEIKVDESALKEASKEVMTKVAEPVVADSEKKTDDESATVTANNDASVAAEEFDVGVKAVAAAAKPGSAMEEVASVTTTQPEADVEKRPTVGCKSGGSSTTSEEDTETEYSGAARPNIAEKAASALVPVKKEAVETQTIEMTPAKESVVFN
ncbi:unnamed protein product [Peronospora belbahrii]|uniref:Uncharacterized protein n=1 Tax=Peronospora belbahrii TaxID=622444 RepID=A0AAU9LE49_9STRA|nr:unnamed protein product [Peronospora belbahrii]CAH0522369.1 unnamed protein product [Peronospora belbahrii]